MKGTDDNAILGLSEYGRYNEHTLSSALDSVLKYQIIDVVGTLSHVGIVICSAARSRAFQPSRPGYLMSY